MNTFIYILKDPITLEIRYVGKSNNPNKRLYDHLKCVKPKTHKTNWINSLLRNNKKPILEIIDEVPIANWQFWEKYWIDKLKLTNNLVNHSKGGNGTTTHSYNTIEKMIIRHKENPNYNKCHDKIHYIDKDVLYQKYIIENLSLPKLEKFFNISETTLYRNLKFYGIEKDKNVWKLQCGKNMKVVLQYDLNGTLIKEWNGIPEIHKELGFNKGNIASCCRGIEASVCGYIWRYKEKFVEIDLNRLKRGRPVVQYNKNNEFINTFNSIKEASQITGVRDNNIQDCCASRTKSSGGFIWRYKNETDI